jgi:hypothetical protein
LPKSTPLASLPELVIRYRNKGILVDTNLFVIFLVGTYDRRQLANCRATKAFRIADFDVLSTFLNKFARLVTTPHILTEVSNLAGKMPESQHGGFRKFFARVIEAVTEEPLAALAISRDENFPLLGITDTAIGLVSPGKYLVLTDELNLYGSLGKRGIDVVNFNHIRMLHW